MRKEINSRTSVNKEKAVMIASYILNGFDGLPIENSLTVVSGITTALVKFIEEIRKQVELSEEDGLEKLVLSWMSASDVMTGNKFSKYVSTECVQLNEDELWSKDKD